MDPFAKQRAIWENSERFVRSHYDLLMYANSKLKLESHSTTIQSGIIAATLSRYERVIGIRKNWLRNG